MIRLAIVSLFAETILRDIKSNGPPEVNRKSFVRWGFTCSLFSKSESCFMSYHPLHFSFIYDGSKVYTPSTSSNIPPASFTMTAPAAMSQQWIPISKKASTAPDATRHMLVAAVPDPRSLSEQISWRWINLNQPHCPTKTANCNNGSSEVEKNGFKSLSGPETVF